MTNKKKAASLVSAALESVFQKNLIKAIETMLNKECIVCKLDPSYINGIPDLLILYKNKWASLELKRAFKANKQPLQDYYVKLMNKMSFSRFVYPENRERVLNELNNFFKK